MPYTPNRMPTWGQWLCLQGGSVELPNVLQVLPDFPSLLSLGPKDVYTDILGVHGSEGLEDKERISL